MVTQRDRERQIEAAIEDHEAEEAYERFMLRRVSAPMGLLARVNVLLRAGNLCGPDQNAIRDIAAALEAHLQHCPSIEPPQARITELVTDRSGTHLR